MRNCISLTHSYKTKLQSVKNANAKHRILMFIAKEMMIQRTCLHIMIWDIRLLIDWEPFHYLSFSVEGRNRIASFAMHYNINCFKGTSNHISKMLLVSRYDTWYWCPAQHIFLINRKKRIYQEVIFWTLCVST